MQESYTATINRLNIEERYCALTMGILFLVAGIAGFIPACVSTPIDVPDLKFSDGYGYLFGLFPINSLHNALHLTVGVIGIAAYTSPSGALVFNRGVAILYSLKAVMGLLPLANTTFGIMPLFGNNVWLNILTAAIAAYYGFVKPTQIKPIDIKS